jgi:hypothetical protein
MSRERGTKPGNAFVDTFRYQAAVAGVATLLVICFARGRSLGNLVRWVVAMVR